MLSFPEPNFDGSINPFYLFFAFAYSYTHFHHVAIRTRYEQVITHHHLFLPLSIYDLMTDKTIGDRLA